MARIENTSERTFHLSLGTKDTEGRRTSLVTVEIPPQTKSDAGVKTNGSAEVDDKLIAEARKNDPVVKHWFDCGDLVFARDAPAVEAKAEAKETPKK